MQGDENVGKHWTTIEDTMRAVDDQYIQYRREEAGAEFEVTDLKTRRTRTTETTRCRLA